MAQKEFNIADQLTVEEIKEIVDLIASNIDNIKTDINNTKNNVVTNNNANSTGILSQKLSYIISTLIGTTSATGGSATTGTLMSKINTIIGYIITNNTANASGNLSQKMTKVINDLSDITTKLNNIVTNTTNVINNGGIIPYSLDIHNLSKNKILNVGCNIQDTSTALQTILNISGKGAISHISLSSSSLNNTLKDLITINLILDNIIYDFSPSNNNTNFNANMFFGYFSRDTDTVSVYKRSDQNGNYLASIPFFKNSLKLQVKRKSTSYDYSSLTGNLIKIYYILAD